MQVYREGQCLALDAGPANTENRIISELVTPNGMDWRIVVAGLVVSGGFVLGWVTAGTLGDAVVSAVLVSCCLAVSVLVDKCVYGL